MHQVIDDHRIFAHANRLQTIEEGCDSYWRLIEADDALRGPRGGRQITYRNVSRYLDNSGFVSLVANAWIGTTMSQTAVLEAVVREVIASVRTVAIAVKTVDTSDTPETDDTDEYDALDAAGLFYADPG